MKEIPLTPEEIVVRLATLKDAGTIAHHRSAMFLAMGVAVPAVVDRLGIPGTVTYFRLPRNTGDSHLFSPSSIPFSSRFSNSQVHRTRLAFCTFAQPASGADSLVVRPRCHAENSIEERATNDKEKNGRM
jgi:hypothetical protein